jgi:hypothetical protein
MNRCKEFEQLTNIERVRLVQRQPFCHEAVAVFLLTGLHDAVSSAKLIVAFAGHANPPTKTTRA